MRGSNNYISYLQHETDWSSCPLRSSSTQPLQTEFQTHVWHGNNDNIQMLQHEASSSPYRERGGHTLGVELELGRTWASAGHNPAGISAPQAEMSLDAFVSSPGQSDAQPIFLKATTCWAWNTHSQSAKKLPRLPSTSKSLLDVKMLTSSLLKCGSAKKKKITSFQIFCNPCHLQHMFAHNDVPNWSDISE